MSERFPQQGELVVGTVARVMRHGVTVKLDEYDGLEAFVPLSEISLKWVRNIRDYLREGQRTVFKVIRSSPQKLQVDVSYRRVTVKERADKMSEWNRRMKVGRMVSILAERGGVDRPVIEEGLVKPARERHIELYELFEDIASGEEPPDWVSLPSNLRDELVDLCRKEIKRSIAVSKSYIRLYAGRAGVELIREAVKKAMDEAGQSEKVSITVVGPPKYLLRAESETAEGAEELRRRAIEALTRVLAEKGGVIEVLEEKS